LWERPHLAICFRSSPFRAAARLSCWRENINICVVSVNVGFVSLSEALDLTTPSGRALAGMLAIFAEFEHDILRDRVKAGIAQARKEGGLTGDRPVLRSTSSKSEHWQKKD
jgi:DNA invertase Pin-like site-specific DNA recombinase